MYASIVIPTFNQGPFIKDCLQSIQNQTFQDFEVIIQDSESTDETQVICRDFVSKDSRFYYFREKDSGQSDAINRGLNRSRGVAWTWICSDDYYTEPQALETLLERLKIASEANGDVIGVYGDAQYVAENGKYVGPYYNCTTDLGRDDFKLNWPLAQPSSFLIRNVVVEAGGVDKDLNLGMDLDLFLNVLKGNRKFVYVPQKTVSIRLQPNSKSVRYRKKTAENALVIVKKHFGSSDIQHSMYFREYAISKRLEILAAIEEAILKVFPFLKYPLKFLSTINQSMRMYMTPEYDGVKTLKVFAFRCLWHVYRVWVICLVEPAIKVLYFFIKRPIKYVLAHQLKVKHSSQE